MDRVVKRDVVITFVVVIGFIVFLLFFPFKGFESQDGGNESSVDLNLTEENESNLSNVSGLSALSKGDVEENVTVYWFWSEGCPLCKEYKPFIDEIDNESFIDVERFQLKGNRTNIVIFQQFLEYHNVSASNAGVPSTFAGEGYWIGYGEGLESDVEGFLVDCVTGERDCELVGRDSNSSSSNSSMD